MLASQGAGGAGVVLRHQFLVGRGVVGRKVVGLGQALLLHLPHMTSSPSQGLPPCRGGVQLLLLLLLPPPQVLEHRPQRPHRDSTPSTGKFTGKAG